MPITSAAERFKKRQRVKKQYGFSIRTRYLRRSPVALNMRVIISLH